MIETENLKLIPCELAHFEAILHDPARLERMLSISIADGWIEFPEAMSYGYEYLKTHTEARAWWTYLFIHRADRALIGTGGFKGPANDAGMVEIGYSISPLYRNRGLYYSKKGDSDAALADFNRSIEIDPHDFPTYLSRGSEFQKRGDLNAALDDFNKALQIGPQIPDTYLQRGVILFLMGKDAEAQKDFDQSLKLDPRMKTLLEKRLAEAKKQREAKQQ